jgi:hypothetical protein
MFRLITESAASQAIHAAARLGLADLLRDGPSSVEELAAATGAHAPSLFRLLRALAGAGVIHRDRAGRFGLTPLAATLQTGVPGSMREAALLTPHPPGGRPWGDIFYSVMTGRPAFEHEHGERFFDYLAHHPDEAARFDAGMTGASRRHAQEMLAACDFAPFRLAVDVGGGQGLLLAMLLAAHPSLRGVLFDRPAVVRDATYLQEAGVADRCRIVEGDFFERVPPGGDLYILKGILHDWADEPAGRILRNCRNAMAEGGRILAFEMLVPSGNRPHPALFMDLNLMVLTGGRERTRAEFRSLFRAVGLKLARVMRTPSPFSLLEGEAV